MSMLTRPAARNRRTVAFVAALVLILQTALAAWSSAAMAAAVELDAFGNPLCITGSIDDHGDRAPTDHSAMPACCTVGCGTASNALSGPPADPVALVFPPMPTGGSAAAFVRVHILAAEHHPGSPRAPPLTA